MSDEDEALATILSSTRADRKLVVGYLKLQTASGTKSPEIASNIFNALIQQEYVNWEDDAELTHIEDIAQTLADRTDDDKLWGELFNRINAL